MTASYYLWKWAVTDISCPPDQVLAQLLAGRRHPGIVAFDPAGLLEHLDRGARLGRAQGEQWEWQVIPAAGAGLAIAIFLSGEIPENRSHGPVAMAQVLWPTLLEEDMSVCCETDGPCLGPRERKNRFTTGQGMEAFDVTEKTVRDLLLTLRRSVPDPFAILENRRGDFVQCYLEKNRRYVLEWRQFHKPLWDASSLPPFSHWRLMDQERLAALPPDLKNSKAELANDQDPDLVGFPLVLEAFRAFLRDEIPPLLKHWRFINDELP